MKASLQGEEKKLRRRFLTEVTRYTEEHGEIGNERRAHAAKNRR